jgi:hypothetical protein
MSNMIKALCEFDKKHPPATIDYVNDKYDEEEDQKEDNNSELNYCPNPNTEPLEYAEYILKEEVKQSKSKTKKEINEGEVVHYYQCAPAYNRLHKSMCSSGCIPTSLTVIMKYFEDYVDLSNQTYTDPDSGKTRKIDVDDPSTTEAFFRAKGWKTIGGASKWNWKSWIKEIGLTGTDVNLVGIEAGTGLSSFNFQLAEKYLEKGCLIFGSSSAHGFVIVDVDETKNTMVVRDSARSKDNGGIQEMAITGDDPNGWTQASYYAHPICVAN